MINKVLCYECDEKTTEYVLIRRRGKLHFICKACYTPSEETQI